MSAEVTHCHHCNHEMSGHFCSNCGQPKQLKKINGQYLLSEIGSILNFDKGLFFTIRELLLRPGLSIQKYIHKDRSRLVKPIVFIIVCSLIYSMLQYWFHFEDEYIGVGGSTWEDSAVVAVFEWISKNYGYVNILLAVFIAFWIQIFFKKYGYNFFEIIVLLSYLMGIGMLIYGFLGVLDHFTTFKVFDNFSLVAFFYMAWGIGQFFDRKKKMNYVKAFFSYMLGMFLLMFVAMGIGLFIDWMNH